MYKVGVKIPMNVGHYLVGDFDDESRPHRHPYEVEWCCTIESLDENGFSVDIARMKYMMQKLSVEIAGLMLNDLPFFDRKQTSIENFAGYVDFWLREFDNNEGRSIFPNLFESEIRVWEDPGAWASVIIGR